MFACYGWPELADDRPCTVRAIERSRATPGAIGDLGARLFEPQKLGRDMVCATQSSAP